MAEHREQHGAYRLKRHETDCEHELKVDMIKSHFNYIFEKQSSFGLPLYG